MKGTSQFWCFSTCQHRLTKQYYSDAYISYAVSMAKCFIGSNHISVVEEKRYLTISDKDASSVTCVDKIRLLQRDFVWLSSISTAPSAVRAQRCSKDHCWFTVLGAHEHGRSPTLIGSVPPNASKPSNSDVLLSSRLGSSLPFC